MPRVAKINGHDETHTSWHRLALYRTGRTRNSEAHESNAVTAHHAQAIACDRRDPGNPFSEKYDYLTWSAWRRRGNWDGRADYTCQPIPRTLSVRVSRLVSGLVSCRARCRARYPQVRLQLMRQAPSKHRLQTPSLTTRKRRPPGRLFSCASIKQTDWRYARGSPAGAAFQILRARISFGARGTERSAKTPLVVNCEICRPAGALQAARAGGIGQPTANLIERSFCILSAKSGIRRMCRGQA
jgi:hypothetical protein